MQVGFSQVDRRLAGAASPVTKADSVPDQAQSRLHARKQIDNSLAKTDAASAERLRTAGPPLSRLLFGPIRRWLSEALEGSAAKGRRRRGEADRPVRHRLL
jgi:hypothetical protein